MIVNINIRDVYIVTKYRNVPDSFVFTSTHLLEDIYIYIHFACTSRDTAWLFPPNVVVYIYLAWVKFAILAPGHSGKIVRLAGETKT